jgi:hypothetical protein
MIDTFNTLNSVTAAGAAGFSASRLIYGLVVRYGWRVTAQTT